MRSVIIFAILAVCLAANSTHHKHHSNHSNHTNGTVHHHSQHAQHEDKASQILDDISKGVDVASKIKNLFGGSGSEGNQEFALEADNELSQHKTHQKKDKIDEILGDISKGVEVANKIKGLFGGHKHSSSHQSSGNQEFALEADNELSQHKTHNKSHKKSSHKKDKIDEILGDISKGVDVANQIKGLFGGHKHSESSGNQEFALEADNQLSQHKSHKKSHKKDKIDEIFGDITKGIKVAKGIEGLFGGHKHSGSSSSTNQEFALEADNQLDKASQILDDISKGVDVAQKIAGLFKKTGSKRHSHSSKHSTHSSHSSSHSTSGSSSSNQEFILF